MNTRSKKHSSAPSLERLKNDECTLPELQAALVQLIELHNDLHASLNEMIDKGRIQSTKVATMNATYGL
jgi:hypothetical protein